MPTYTMHCERCNVHWDIVRRMKEEKKDDCPRCKNAGKRVFDVPQMSVNAKLNPFDTAALTKKTGEMKGTIGDLFDFSKEMSEKRGGQDDPIRKKTLENWAKERKGKKFKETKKNGPARV